MADITFDPYPGEQGEDLVISAPVGTVLELDWDPSGAGPAQVTIGSKGAIKIQCPSNATSLVAIDQAGQLANATLNILPA